MDLNIVVAWANAGDLYDVRAFYSERGYRHSVSPDDLVFVGTSERQIIGAVRLCQEQGALVLRGMQVAPEWQRRGVGSRLLEVLDTAIGTRACYCLPYTHLQRFYGRIGFVPTDARDAPKFLPKRLNAYQSLRPDFILMCRPGRTGP